MLHRENVRDLTSDRMDRVVRKYIRGADNRTNRNCAAVGGYLPLVVTNNAELQEFAEIFFQRKNLPNSPFVGEDLPRRLVGVVCALPLSVYLPVREQVHTGPFVLGETEGASCLQMVSKVSHAAVICC